MIAIDSSGGRLAASAPAPPSAARQASTEVMSRPGALLLATPTTTAPTSTASTAMTTVRITVTRAWTASSRHSSDAPAQALEAGGPAERGAVQGAIGQGGGGQLQRQARKARAGGRARGSRPRTAPATSAAQQVRRPGAHPAMPARTVRPIAADPSAMKPSLVRDRANPSTPGVISGSPPAWRRVATGVTLNFAGRGRGAAWMGAAPSQDLPAPEAASS
jgi:hypothetical protein